MWYGAGHSKHRSDKTGTFKKIKPASPPVRATRKVWHMLTGSGFDKRVFNLDQRNIVDMSVDVYESSYTNLMPCTCLVSGVDRESKIDDLFCRSEKSIHVVCETIQKGFVQLLQNALRYPISVQVVTVSAPILPPHVVQLMEAGADVRFMNDPPGRRLKAVSSLAVLDGSLLISGYLSSYGQNNYEVMVVSTQCNAVEQGLDLFRQMYFAASDSAPSFSSRVCY